jgi:hypothetical protein
MPVTESEWESMPRFEMGEGESESEWLERLRFPKPSTKPSFQRRTPPSFVTQVQLEAALARVDGKIKTVSDGVSTLTARVNTLNSTIKKENEERKKEIDGQKKDLNQKVQLLALLPLLIKPPTYTIAAKAIDPIGNLPAAAVTLSADPGGSLNALLPLLLVSGFGTSSGGLGLGGDSGSDNSLMLLALVLAFAH